MPLLNAQYNAYPNHIEKRERTEKVDMAEVYTDINRLADELKAFDDTKAGVKGLVDSGILTIPSFFIHPQDDQAPSNPVDPNKVTVIDLTGVENDVNRRKQIVNEIRNVAETLGLFQVVNHGIPDMVLEEMLKGTSRFYEQDNELKKEFYTRDRKNKVHYCSNFDLYLGAPASWRDTFNCRMAPELPKPEEVPDCFRDIVFEYSKQVMDLAKVLFELLSEALGLPPRHLNEMGCNEGLIILGNYYPPCPQPHLTIGIAKHTDTDFFTLLLQDQVGGLQCLIEDQWVDIPPKHGAIVVNIGDALQLITNDKFKSPVHRVVVNSTKFPRVSVAAAFRNPFEGSQRLYGPIKELISEDNPPRYRETSIKEMFSYRTSIALASDTRPLSLFRI